MGPVDLTCPFPDVDRQWLSFWIIYLAMTVFESVSDVLLSWMPSYYETKLVLLSWLVLCHGSDWLYRTVHSLFKKLMGVMRRVGIIARDESVEWDEECWLETLPEKLQVISFLSNYW